MFLSYRSIRNWTRVFSQIYQVIESYERLYYTLVWYELS